MGNVEDGSTKVRNVTNAKRLAVTITVHSSEDNGSDVEVSVFGLEGDVIGSARGVAGEEFEFTVEGSSTWSPESPNLHNITVTMGDDEVQSYTGFRTISTGEVDGVQRPMLNGEFVFQFGTLDQGYWPDGLYTPPNYEAMVYDIDMLKDLGFNMLRKHVSEREAASVPNPTLPLSGWHSQTTELAS